jgi:hypothetical protein
MMVGRTSSPLPPIYCIIVLGTLKYLSIKRLQSNKQACMQTSEAVNSNFRNDRCLTETAREINETKGIKQKQWENLQ